MASFWDHSWDSISTQRILEYASTHSPEPDDCIRLLHRHGAKSLCDAGCGCGVYSLKLAANGFAVSGFDISTKAVEIASELFRKAGFPASFRQSSILATPYPDGSFDCVLSRDVLDHVEKHDCAAAIRELLRITVPGGLVLITTDSPDEEYESEPHIVNADGDYVFTQGKWEGMVFHPYTPGELASLVPVNTAYQITGNFQGLVLSIEKGCAAK